jgi:hypothetical protein
MIIPTGFTCGNHSRSKAVTYQGRDCFYSRNAEKSERFALTSNSGSSSFCRTTCAWSTRRCCSSSLPVGRASSCRSCSGCARASAVARARCATSARCWSTGSTTTCGSGGGTRARSSTRQTCPSGSGEPLIRLCLEPVENSQDPSRLNVRGSEVSRKREDNVLCMTNIAVDYGPILNDMYQNHHQMDVCVFGI